MLVTGMQLYVYGGLVAIVQSYVEVWEWISNFIPHFIGHVITYLGWKLFHVRKRDPCSTRVYSIPH